MSARAKQPLLDFILSALRSCGCTIVHQPPADRAPYRIVFDTPAGERHGIVAYVFFANAKKTRNRPDDEHRFQIKYGTKDGKLHDIWTDPYGLYTTLLIGVDPHSKIFVGADPALNSPTRFFISKEFKEGHVLEIQRHGWFAWERERRAERDIVDPIEVLVGGKPEAFLRYVRFEREAFGEDQGHRQLLAERVLGGPDDVLAPATPGVPVDERRVHALAAELQLGPDEILDLISEAKRLKMAVRGWVAEEHLVRKLRTVKGVTECRRDDEEGHPDVSLRFEGSAPLRVECKNVLRQMRNGLPRIDFQRTRASKADPCTRYYRPQDFDLVAACLHAVTEQWEFRFAATSNLAPHKKCGGRLASDVRVDAAWASNARDVLLAIAKRTG